MATNSTDVIAVISPQSVGGLSMFDMEETFTPDNIEEFRSEESVINRTINELQRLGFEIMNVGPLTISFGGPQNLFKKIFGVKLRKEKIEVMEGMPKVEYFGATLEDEKQLRELPQALKSVAEGVAIAHPPELFESPLPSIAPIDPKAYRYFFVPDEIAVLLRSARVHRLGGTGNDIVVAMIDTGHYAHPFFNWHGYRVLPTLLGPGQTNPGDDLVGHGTGESANIFAAAPDIKLRPIKGLSDPVGDFNVAMASTPKPHIISNSWGYNIDYQSWVEIQENEPYFPLTFSYLRLLEATIVLAISDGIVVCFSAGNLQKRGFPSSMPEVISVGGVHVNYPDLSLEASSYASSFASKLYPGRHCPDLCGLTGKAAKIGANNRAPSIMLPVQPGSALDAITPSTGATDDGWGLFSGTSAACPQVAGVAALLLEKKPGMTPADVKAKLMATARDVKTGASSSGETAGSGPDDATGAGLVDAKWAYITTFSDVAAEFIMASTEKQKEMLEAGQMPRAAEDFMADFIDTLRSR
jgi:hypothetical protein